MWKTYSAILFAFCISVLGGIAGWYLATGSVQINYLPNILLSFCAGLLVSLVFTIVIQSVLARQSTIELEEYQKINMSVGLYQTFHSLEMLEARCRVERMFKRIEGRSVTVTELHQELYMNAQTNDDEKDWLAFSGLLRFYENMAELIYRGLLRKNVARRNYKRYFDWLMNEPAMISLLEVSRERNDGGELFTTIRRLQREVFVEGRGL